MAHRLTKDEWRPLESAHQARVDALTAAHLSRRKGARTHPVEDFLFSYYMHSPAQLRRWHPGPGVVLEGADERAGWKFYQYAEAATTLDLDAFLATRVATVHAVRELLAATAERPAQLGCFGLHEWAMVYRQTPDRFELAREARAGHARGAIRSESPWLRAGEDRDPGRQGDVCRCAARPRRARAGAAPAAH